MKKIKIYMGLPSTGTRCDSQTYALREITERYGDRVEFVYPTQCAFRIFHDFARNEIVEEFLASDCDVLWFMDSDICPPKHILDLVTSHWDKWKLAGACYPIFMPIPNSGSTDHVVQFTAYRGLHAKGIALSAVPSEGTEFLDGLATGCLFIKREVFAQLQKPYFEFKYDPETRMMKEGEDLGFCLKVSKLGLKFFTDFSMVCSHYKNVNLLAVNNYAIDHANNQVKSYDSEIRERIEEACRAAYVKGRVDERRERSPGPSVSKGGLVLPTY